MEKYKFLIPVFFSVLCGLLIGQIFFSKYDTSLKDATNEKELVYFIEINTYQDEESAKASDQNNLFLIETDGIHEYAGITKNLENAKKIKEIYASSGNNTYIREKILEDETFITELREYDKLISAFEGTDEIKSILKSIISSYKEKENNANN